MIDVPFSHYNKEEKPIFIQECRELFKIKDYKIIAQTSCKNGNFIITMWLGINHSEFTNEFLIFQSMIFDENGKSIYLKRYATEKEALKGHKKLIKSRSIADTVNILYITHYTKDK